MKKIALTILIMVFGLDPVLVAAGDIDAVIRMVDETQSAKRAETPKEIGTAASEVLGGSGGRAGYVLGHGNIIAGSEWVYIGVKRARHNVDYTIDYLSGTLTFSEPVGVSDSVRVDYRYSEQAKGERNVTSPGMLLRLGSSLQMNLTYAYRAADPAQGQGTPDVLTYGFNSTTKLGGASTLSSLMFITTPQRSNRMSLATDAIAPDQTKAAPKEVKKDRLIVQDADLGLGKARLKLGYQDVGEDFEGFASMRDSNAAAAGTLNALEKEKGIRRMNIAGEIPAGGQSSLTFGMASIRDKQDDIMTRAVGYNSSNLKLNMSMREIGAGFSKFTQLREADAAQMANEAGIRRTSYGLQFRTGKTGANAPAWSGLNWTKIEGGTGTLDEKSADLELGKARLQADVRTMDPAFNRMAALNDDERARLALIARRQFNPKAQIAEVTAQDKAQIGNEAGLNRKNYMLQLGGGSVNTWLSLSSIDSQNGGLNRTAVAVEGKRFNLSFSHHSIDRRFDRLSSLQAAEVANFGNEYGMTRTTLGGHFRFGFGEFALANSLVSDGQGSDVMRRSLDFKRRGLSLHANFQDISPGFARITDLSDADRSLLEAERGFKRADYAINFQATKDINVDSYIYDSTNLTAGQTRGQNRHQITYAPKKGPHVTALMDDSGYVSETGNLSNHSRRRLTFDNKFNILGGLLFKGLSDTSHGLEGSTNPVDTSVTQTHIESDQSAKHSFTLDTIQTDLGGGRFEDTRGIGMKTRAAKNMSLVGSYSTTDPDRDPEANRSAGIDWALTKKLNLAFSFNNRDGGPNGSQRSSKFALNGSLADRFLMFRNVRISSGRNTTDLAGKQVGCDSAMKLEAGAPGGNLVYDTSDKLNPTNGIYYTSRVFRYETDKDAKKRYHVSYFRQSLVTPTGAPAERRNHTLDLRLSRGTNLAFADYFGKDAQNGEVLPVGGRTLKFTRQLNSRMSFLADYTTDRNDCTGRRARTSGLGLSGTLPSSAVIELYYGWCELAENGTSGPDRVFRFKYDRKIDADHYLTLTAQKKSRVDISSINPYEGDTVARIDFRTVYH